MKLVKYAFNISLLFVSGVAFAQNPIPTTDQPTTNPTANAGVNPNWKPSLVRDGVIDRVEHTNRVTDWSNIRENDVAWVQRIWRDIDVRQKQNQAFIYEGDEFSGGGAFVEILNDLIKKGKIQAYSPLDDKFTTPLSQEAFKALTGGTTDSVWLEDPVTQERTLVLTPRIFDLTAITKYRIKEDWVFDRNLGRLVVRIIGIAPLKDKIDDNGNFRGTTEMYWIYYPEARKELVNYEVYNPTNMVRRLNWTDYLDGRFFASYIIKTNINNASQTQLPENINGLYEGQRIMEDIINRESDMWER